MRSRQARIRQISNEISRLSEELQQLVLLEDDPDRTSNRTVTEEDLTILKLASTSKSRIGIVGNME